MIECAIRNLKIGLGAKAERIASQYLESKGYDILDRNFRCRLGELDIVAKDRDTICFIEIRSRNSDSIVMPEETITLEKQKRLTRLALFYLKFKRIIDADIRFDVVSIMFDRRRLKRISLIKGAFECDQHYLY